MKRSQVRKSGIKGYNSQLQEYYGIESYFSKSDTVEILEGEQTILLVNGDLLFFFIDSQPIPTLTLLQKDMLLKTVTVDMGAVKFVTGGADIMRPGIVTCDDGISEGEYVAVVDEKNRMPLSVSLAMYDGVDIVEMDSGKVLKNIHYVGDKLWTLLKSTP